MIDIVMRQCGPVFGPALLALSVAVWALGIAMVLGAFQGHVDALRRLDALIRRTGAVCTQVGLLGTVVGMIDAFGSTRAPGLDPELTRALGLCFWTTAVGAVHALLANGFSLLAASIASMRAPRPRPR
ncbi:MAG: MotA/TolQ/ExbB proton channel family protein [Planctomycetes bacterium]|nr:MotA/TolQ/ExbB proton channel family protein [Planctomycetota bacterium]